MTIETHLNQTLSSLEVSKIDYNNNIKELLADIQILSRILKYTVKEIQHLSLEEIAECLHRAKIEVGTTPVDPGLTNAGKVLSENTEDAILNEGSIVFDVRVTFSYKAENIRLIINVEAQKTTAISELKYHIESRMVYYLSRLISSQKSVEFFHDDYDNIKKVYSIWICTDAPNDSDSVCEYSFKPEITYGKAEASAYADKMKGIIIRVRKDTDVEESKHILIMMLEDLLKNNLKEQKKEVLVKKYGMQMNVELERRINLMCNLGDNLVEDAMKKGQAIGIIEFGLELGWEKDRILSRLQSKLDMSVETAQEYFEKYACVVSKKIK